MEYFRDLTKDEIMENLSDCEDAIMNSKDIDELAFNMNEACKYFFFADSDIFDYLDFPTFGESPPDQDYFFSWSDEKILVFDGNDYVTKPRIDK